MGIRDIADRIKHTRIAKAESTENETRKHDEMAKKYDEKKKFHSSHNQDKPKEESAKEKVLRGVMSHGKKFVEKSRQKAQEEAARQGKRKKSKKGSTGTRQSVDPRPQNQFSFGFGNVGSFGYDFATKKSESKEEPKQQKGFNFGFGQSDIPYDEMFDFRNKRDHSKLFKKKKSDSIEEAWNPKDFWN